MDGLLCRVPDVYRWNLHDHTRVMAPGKVHDLPATRATLTYVMLVRVLAAVTDSWSLFPGSHHTGLELNIISCAACMSSRSYLTGVRHSQLAKQGCRTV